MRGSNGGSNGDGGSGVVNFCLVALAHLHQKHLFVALLLLEVECNFS
jgi:hypothetical protein